MKHFCPSVATIENVVAHPSDSGPGGTRHARNANFRPVSLSRKVECPLCSPDAALHGPFRIQFLNQPPRDRQPRHLSAAALKHISSSQSISKDRAEQYWLRPLFVPRGACCRRGSCRGVAVTGSGKVECPLVRAPPLSHPHCPLVTVLIS
jgi:hypothetical protein